MKKTVMRILGGAMFFALISGIVVLIIGFMSGWKTSTQFSDGFFWASAIMVSFGLISFLGYSQRTIEWPPVNLASADRTKLWSVDIFRGRILMVVFGVSGLLLFGLSLLVSRLF